MLLDIINEYDLYVECDMDNAYKYAVKIELSCCPQHPATLHNGKNGIPMLAKEFVERVKQCKETGKSLSIDWECEIDKEPRAWTNGCAGDSNVKNAKCEINNSANAVIIRVVG